MAHVTVRVVRTQQHSPSACLQSLCLCLMYFEGVLKVYGCVYVDDDGWQG